MSDSLESIHSTLFEDLAYSGIPRDRAPPV